MISPFRQKLKIPRRLIIFAVAIILLIIGGVLFISSTGHVISASWAFVVTAIFSVFGVLIALLQLFAPIAPPASSSPALLSVPSKKRMIYQSLEETPPFVESETTLPRKEAVRNIYETLIQKDITTVVLTGVGGVGKTWLASLVCSYAEMLRQAGKGPFNTEVLWLKTSQDVTMIDLVGTILEAQGQYRAELDSFTPGKQAEALLDALNTTDKARLIVLDQFELLLNEQGYVREDRSGISEWIDLINTHPCVCRILITSRREPVGTFANRPSFREIHSERLTTKEGIELLRRQGVGATEGELHKAVESSEDNPLVLTQIASLVRERSLSLDILFDSSRAGSYININVAASLKTTSQKELAETVKLLEQAVMGSKEVSHQQKHELIEVINQIGKELMEGVPNTALLQIISDSLLATLRTIPDTSVSSIAEAAAPMFAKLYKEQKRSNRLINILFLAANPKGMSLLKLDDELRDIQVALHQTEFRQRFDIKQQWVVSEADLQGYLIRHTPDIVHFSGHGSPSGQIILEDSSGNNHPISPGELSQIFSVLKNNVRCVVLDACYSGQQAQAIAQHVGCVVGISSAINDATATSFAAAFYRALGFGRSIKTAFDLGSTQIALENLDEQDTPQLLTVNGNPEDIALVNDNS